MTSPEAEVRALFEQRADAMKTKDIERLMALYADDVVYFDLVPPLRYVGAAALRARFTGWFPRWQGPIGQETHELRVVADGDVAGAHMLVRASGTLQDGRVVDYFVRVTNICRRSDHGWSIVHEHVSSPVDLATRQAVMDLTP